MQVAEEMMSEGRPYAALGELDTLGTRHPEVQLARAQVLARIGHPDARDNFEEVRRYQCHRGPAHHGLGLLALEDGDLDAAGEYLGLARRDLPNVAEVRNDYGFVLLMAGQEAEAEFELRSALELSEGGERPLENLLLLYMSRDEVEEMHALVRRYGVDEQMVRRLEARAARLESARKALRDGVPADLPMDGRAPAPGSATREEE